MYWLQLTTVLLHARGRRLNSGLCPPLRAPLRRCIFTSAACSHCPSVCVCVCLYVSICLLVSVCVSVLRAFFGGLCSSEF